MSCGGRILFLGLVLLLATLSYICDRSVMVGAAKVDDGRPKKARHNGPVAKLSERDRVALWRANGNTWPPTWQPISDAKKKVMADREAEVMALEASDERWENWLQLTQGYYVPTFTEDGFMKGRVPKKTFQKLLDRVENMNFDALPSEGNVEVIYSDTDLRPKMLYIGDLAYEILEELRPLHEQWAGGIELEGTSSYGIRFYQDGNALVMHQDRVETHVISSIIHVAHQYDNEDEPWPVEIEDHDGKLHAEVLEPGDMLFYESSHNLHGRMSMLKGKYYGAIFVHYKPKDPKNWNIKFDDIIAHVPPHWSENIKVDKGSRFSGAALTINSRVCVNAAPRLGLGGHLGHNNYNATLYKDHIYADQIKAFVEESKYPSFSKQTAGVGGISGGRDEL